MGSEVNPYRFVEPNNSPRIGGGCQRVSNQSGQAEGQNQTDEKKGDKAPIFDSIPCLRGGEEQSYPMPTKGFYQQNWWI